MFDLFNGLSSILGDIHSISENFLVPAPRRRHRWNTSRRPHSSRIKTRDLLFGHPWRLGRLQVRNMDVFRRQGLLPMLGGHPGLRLTAYAHARLVLASPQNVSSLRVLQYAAESPCVHIYLHGDSK